MVLRIQGGGTSLVECINPYTNKWMVLWDQRKVDEKVSYLTEIFDHRPTLEEVRLVIFDWYNTQTNQKILSGFTWRGIPIWLSMENQFNYKVAYDLAIQSKGKILPTFKFGTADNPVYYKFKTLEDLENFYTNAMSYISSTLEEGWRLKDSIDWTVYEELLSDKS